MFSSRSTLITRRAFALALVLLAMTLLEARAQRTIDIARQQITRLEPGMTSADLAIYGARIGMPWDAVRSSFEREGIPYLFAKTIPVTVYIPPLEPTYYMVLNSSTYTIDEMGVMGDRVLPLENMYLANCRHWRLTTARTFFFNGDEGHYVLNEEGESYQYEKRGFALKYLAHCDFRFVLVEPGGFRPPPPPPPKLRPALPAPFVTKVPFFVTGYYEPNTTNNWRRLQERMERGELSDAKYIDLNDENYSSLAKRADAEFARMYTYIESYLRSLSAYGEATSTMLRISISGFVDPRRLVRGIYVDSSVVTDSLTIEHGVIMEGQEGNRQLANLRAWYTMKALDDYLSAQSELYRGFRQSNRILWSAGGKGISPTDGDLKEMRRIEIVLQFTQ